MLNLSLNSDSGAILGQSSGRQVYGTGVNKQGNEYKSFTDGAYTYKNPGGGNFSTFLIVNIS